MAPQTQAEREVLGRASRPRLQGKEDRPRVPREMLEKYIAQRHIASGVAYVQQG